MKFSKKDLFYSIVTGLLTGLIVWGITGYLHVSPVFHVPFVSLVVIVPILWIVGVNLGYFLGRFFGFFNQFGKFAAIGFTNAAVDFGVLSLLLSFFGVTAGILYTVSKTISFIVASTHSFFWNKFWVFEAGGSGDAGKQFGKFFIVSAFSAIINISVASLIVNIIHPIIGINVRTWALLGAVVGSAVALIVSFLGFRLTVFNRKNVPNSVSKISSQGF